MHYLTMTKEELNSLTKVLTTLIIAGAVVTVVALLALPAMSQNNNNESNNPVNPTATPIENVCTSKTVHLLDIGVELPCNWYIAGTSTTVKTLSQEELNNYVKANAQSKDWPIIKKNTIKLTNDASTLTFEKEYYFFPGGVGGVPTKINNPEIVYKASDKSFDLVRIQNGSDTYEYYPAYFVKDGADGTGYYHIGLGNGPIKITLTKADENTLKTIDAFVKMVCIDKKSLLCQIAPNQEYNK